MADERKCSCCKDSFQSLNESGLCFACDAFQVFASIIKESTDLSEEEVLDLASNLHESILSQIIDRLQQPGQDHPLVTELLKTMVPTARPH
jgi:hypothetical protein